MNFLYKFERKFGKYSIKNLSLVLALLFAFNYLLSVAAPDVYLKLLLIPYNVFEKHEFWRLFTWIFTAPSDFDEWTVLSLVCLYFIGSSAERGMGTFLFNLYMRGSMILNFLTVICVSAFYYFLRSDDISAYTELNVGGIFINWLVPSSIFFAFAIAYMENTILFMFVFPLKAKYIAAIDFAIWLYYYFKYPYTTLRALIIVNCAAFFLFYNIFKKYNSRSRGMYSFKDYGAGKKKQHKAFKTERSSRDNVYNMSDYVGRKNSGSEKMMPEGITRHKCAICGKTENDGEELVFRFCTKCNGNYEYCNEHIYTHEHVK